MGVPMRRTTVTIYALGGFYSALGGVIYALYTSSGYPLAGIGDELTAIASVVLGGTLLTGGVGLVAGTLFGGMILGLIATLINFNGSLNGAWIMISGGVLLFLFIVMQRSLLSSFRLRSAASNLFGVDGAGFHTLDFGRPARARRLTTFGGRARRGVTAPTRGLSATSIRRSPGGSAARSSAGSIRPVRCCPMLPTCAGALRFPHRAAGSL